MKLIIKFNLVFVSVFLIGLGIAAYVADTLLQQNARAEMQHSARLIMETALATRGYTSSQVGPLLQTQMKYGFLPQSVPAYSAAEVFNGLRKKFPEYSYKEATLNPTNPRNRAVDWETDVVNQFRNNTESSEIIGERDTPSGRLLYIARPIQIRDGACLARYGPANGFGWKMNEIIGAQVVSVPTDVPTQRARTAFRTFMLSIAGVFVFVGIVLNAMLLSMVIMPVSRLAKLADQVSMGNVEVPDFHVRSRDEIRTLADSFNRMKKSVVQAMKMLDE
jgi:HAMP domain-containing protein